MRESRCSEEYTGGGVVCGVAGVVRDGRRTRSSELRSACVAAWRARAVNVCVKRA